MTTIAMENHTRLKPEWGEPSEPISSSMKQVFASVSNYPVRSSIYQYQKQLVETRRVVYHQHTLRMVSQVTEEDHDARRQIVIDRVARDLWTNFCVRGQDTPMLRYLHQRLCEEFGKDLEFEYKPGSVELVILQKTEDGLVPVPKLEQIDMVNRAWRIAQAVVESHTIKNI